MNPNDGNLADATLNALDFLIGDVQLFDFDNVLTTAAPITVSGSALGLQSVINSVQISAQVVEPPVYVRGGVGLQFHTAGIQLKSAALGQAPLAHTLNFEPPYLETQTLGSSAAFLSNLLSTLRQISRFSSVARLGLSSTRCSTGPSFHSSNRSFRVPSLRSWEPS